MYKMEKHDEDRDTELPQLVHSRRSKSASSGPSAIQQDSYRAEEKIQSESLPKSSTAETILPVPQVHGLSSSLTVSEYSIAKSTESKGKNVDSKGNSVEDDKGQDQTALGTKIIRAVTGEHDVFKKSVGEDMSDHIEQADSNALPKPEKMTPEVDDQTCQVCDQWIAENPSKGPFCSLCALFFKQCVEGELKITRHSDKGPVCQCKLCHLLKCYVKGMEPADPSFVMCIVCKKVFLSSYFLRQHVWKCKPTVNALHCDKCFKYCVTDSQMRQHKRNPFFCKKSESDLQKEYKCDICWKSFSSLRMIVLHRYTHLKFDKEMSDMEKALEIQDFQNNLGHLIITKDGENSQAKKDKVCQKYTENTSPRSGHKKKLDSLDDEEDEQDEDDYIIVSFDSSDEEDKKNDDINSKGGVKDLGAFQKTTVCTKKSGEMNSLKTHTDDISVVESLYSYKTDSISVVDSSDINKTDSISVVDSSNINKTESISVVDHSHITETDSMSISKNSALPMTFKTEVHDERKEEKHTQESQLDETLNRKSTPERDTLRHQDNRGKEKSSLDMRPSCSNAEEKKDEGLMKSQVSEELKKTTSECTPEKDMTSKRISLPGDCSIDELTAALGDKTRSSPENQIQSIIRQLGLRSEVKVTTNNDGTKKVELHFVVDDSTNLSELVPKTKESLMPPANSTSNDEVSSTVPDVPEQESNGPPGHLSDVDQIPTKEIQIKEETLKSDVSSTEEQSVAVETTTNPGLIKTHLEEGLIPTPIEEDRKNMEMPTLSQDEEEEAKQNIKEEMTSSPDVICLSSDEEMEPSSVRDKRPSKEEDVIILDDPSSVNMQSLKGSGAKKMEHEKSNLQRKLINTRSGEKFPLLKKSLNSQSLELSLQENSSGNQLSKGAPSCHPESYRVGNKPALFQKGNLEGETACYKCYLCTSQFNTAEQIKQHLLQIHSYYSISEGWSEKFLCCHCNEGFETFLKLSIHERTVHGLKLSCPVCGILQRDHKQFLSHILDHFSPYIHHCSSNSKGVPDEMEPDCPTTLKTYMKCSLCFKVVPKRLKYYDHIHADHRELFKFHCKVCLQEFCTTSALNVHRSSLNNSSDGSSVNIADVITLYTDTMKIKVLSEGDPSCHPESYRVGNKPALFQKGNLEGETACYKCYLCTGQFNTAEQIKQHLLQIHSYYSISEGWSEKFLCCHCNEGFETFLKLSIHERTVHGFKLSCPVCGIFQRDHKLFLNHFCDHFSPYIHHCSSNSKGVPNEMEPGCPTTLKTYMKCSLCFKVVPKRLKYYDHIMADHRKLFKFHCKVCLQEFCTTSALKVHRSSLNNTLDGSPVNIADVITLYTDTMEIKVLKEVPLTEMFRPFLSTPLISTRNHTSTITEDTYRRNKLLLGLKKKMKEGILPTSLFEKSILKMDRKILPRSCAASGVSTCISPATALPEASSLIANEPYVHKTSVPSLPVKNAVTVVDTVAEKTVETIDVDEVRVSTQKMSSDGKSSDYQKMCIAKYNLSGERKAFVPITDFLTMQTKKADKGCIGSSKRKKEDSNVPPIPHKQARLASSVQEGNIQEEDTQGKPTIPSNPLSSVTESKVREVDRESSNVQAEPDPREVIVIDDPELTDSSLCGSEKSAADRERKEKMAADFSSQKNVPLESKRLNLSPEVEGVISHLVNFWKKAKPMDKKVIAESKTSPIDKSMEESPRPATSAQTSECEKLPVHDFEVSISHNESDLFCGTKQLSHVTNIADNPKSEGEKVNQAFTTSSATSTKAQNMFLTKSVLSVLESNPTLLSNSLKDTQVENIISENTHSVHPYLNDLITSTNWKVSRHVLSKVNAVLHHKFPVHSLAKSATNNQDGLNLAEERQHIFNKIRNDLELSVNNENHTVATLQTEKISVNTQVSKSQVLNVEKNFTETTSLNNFAISESEKDSMQKAAKKSNPTSAVNHSGSDLTGALKRLSSLAHSFGKEKLRKIDQTDAGGSRELQAGRLKLVPANNSNLKSQNPSAGKNLIPEVPNRKRQSFPPNRESIPDVRNLERLSSLVQSIAVESIKKFGRPDLDLKGDKAPHGEKLKLVPAIDFAQLDSLCPPLEENLKVQERRSRGQIPRENYLPDVQKLGRLRSLVDSIAKEKLNEYGQPDLKEIDELQTESLKLVPAVDFSKFDDPSLPTDDNLIPEVLKSEKPDFSNQ